MHGYSTDGWNSREERAFFPISDSPSNWVVVLQDLPLDGMLFPLLVLGRNEQGETFRLMARLETNRYYFAPVGSRYLDTEISRNWSRASQDSTTCQRARGIHDEVLQCTSE